MTNRIIFRSVLLTALIWTSSWVSAEGREVLVIRTDIGEYRLFFDPTRISATELRRLAPFSPHTDNTDPFSSGSESRPGYFDKAPLAVQLELCIANDPEYLACGKRDITDPNFLRNAAINVGKTKKQLEALKQTQVPAELAPIADHYVRSFSFSLWLEETRLEYYRTWDASVLKRLYQNFDVTNRCGPIIDQITGAGSPEQKYRLARVQWHTCVLRNVRPRLGVYPRESWNKFLAKYGIKEEFIFEEVD